MKRISLLVTIMMMVTQLGILGSEDQGHNNFLYQAEVLKEISLFRGTNEGFELDRLATRVEAGVIIVRLLGQEEYALANNYAHPFSDVPSWADAYIGYLYQQGLTKGVSANRYDSEAKVTPDVFMTFCLRSLGYQDGEDGYEWDVSLPKALEIGVMDDFYKAYLNTEPYIYRDDIVGILYNLLNTQLNDNEWTLIDFLIAKGVTTQEEAMALGVLHKSLVTQVDLTIDRIVDDAKWVVVEDDGKVKTILPMAFNIGETAYPAILEGVDADGNSYQVFIPKSIYFENEVKFDLKPGDTILFEGENVLNVLKDDVKTIYIFMRN